ncbi:NAD-P-binding protein [Trametes versicolor FP-101664 SS1]|uniref:NAD-P-binding protein n=1 Tax=Trametes versicolor (strain FP-101664) TaxID=717944 RepID=UPI0004623570|nr:NAD-P-binding protein [Trametes versicolor FP-101664 SS1]EIW55614.1 NAD-P-binding protein [Trametes versicolor FP-101664 SS1]
MSTAQLPAKMHAIGINKTGDFEVIEKIELPVPANAPGNVLVKIHYGGVNFIDTYYRKGLYPIAKFPQPLGTEAAGEIVGLPTDDAVLNDEEYKLRGFALGGKVAIYGLGAFAEYVSVPWAKAYPVPAGLSTKTAAAGLTQGATALTFITEAYPVQKGDTVLVHTVAGGLGLLFAQLIKARGATVIGTTSTAAKAALAKEAGADHVILYTQEDTVQRVLELTGGEGVHAIFDGVGKDTFESDFKMIRRKGTLVSVGNASGAVPPFPPLKLVEKNVRLLRPTMGNYVYTPEEGRRYSTELFKLIADGDLKVRIHAEYPFTAEGVQQAQKDLTGGKTVGKLIIKIAPDAEA